MMVYVHKRSIEGLDVEIILVKCTICGWQMKIGKPWFRFNGPKFECRGCELLREFKEAES